MVNKDLEIFTFTPSDNTDLQEEEIVHMYIASNQYYKMFKEEASERPGYICYTRLLSEI